LAEVDFDLGLFTYLSVRVNDRMLDPDAMVTY
jgi:hypothetical protein